MDCAARQLFLGNQFVSVAAWSHDQRLHNALRPDGIGQLTQRLFRKNCLRGCSGLGVIFATGARSTRSRLSTGGAMAGVAPRTFWSAWPIHSSKAPSPRPKAGFGITQT